MPKPVLTAGLGGHSRRDILVPRRTRRGIRANHLGHFQTGDIDENVPEEENAHQQHPGLRILYPEPEQDRNPDRPEPEHCR